MLSVEVMVSRKLINCIDNNSEHSSLDRMDIDDPESTSPVAKEGGPDFGQELNRVEISIMRMKIHLNNADRNRDRPVLQQHNNSAAVDIGQDALQLSHTLNNGEAIARVSFWLGLALYHSDKIDEARVHFVEARKVQGLGEQEAAYVGGWIARCGGEAPEEAPSLEQT